MSSAMSSALSPRLHGPQEAVHQVMQALRGVVDPNVGENIVDLGLIEWLRVSDDDAELMLVTTTDSCPMSDLIADVALRAMQRALPDCDLYVRHDADLNWTPERAVPATRRRLRWRLSR